MLELPNKLSKGLRLEEMRKFQENLEIKKNRNTLYQAPAPKDARQDLQGSKLLNGCLVVCPNKQILSAFQWFFSIRHWHVLYR